MMALQSYSEVGLEMMSREKAFEKRELPLVSVIIPMRNERESIRRCLGSVLAQDYPQDRMEILVVDGMSTDESPEIVRQLSEAYSNVKLLKNEKRITPSALNVGVENARGDVIIRVDAHTHIESDYVSQCVHYLRTTGADNVGGLMRAVGEGYVGKAIALATSSPLGIGNSQFHYSQREQYVDTVYMGAYPREVFERIGLFDEELVRNQDDEFNYRLRDHGGKIFLTPEIKSHYFCRASLSKMWKQYFQYGLYKPRVLQKHPRLASVRHFIPPAFVSALVTSGVLGLFSKVFALLFLSVLSSYLVFSIVASFIISSKNGWQYFPLLPIAFACLHFAWGTGFLVGMAQLLLPSRRPASPSSFPS